MAPLNWKLPHQIYWSSAERAAHLGLVYSQLCVVIWSVDGRFARKKISFNLTARAVVMQSHLMYCYAFISTTKHIYNADYLVCSLELCINTYILLYALNVLHVELLCPV